MRRWKFQWSCKTEKIIDWDEATDIGLALQEEIRYDILNSYIIDSLKKETDQLHQLNIVNDRFVFLQLDTLLNPDRKDFICVKIDELRDINDYEELKNDIDRFCRLMMSSIDNGGDGKTDFNALDYLKWMIKCWFSEMLTNLTIVLKIFLTMWVSVATCDRSFSKLKLVKTYHRSKTNKSCNFIYWKTHCKEIRFWTSYQKRLKAKIRIFWLILDK